MPVNMKIENYILTAEICGDIDHHSAKSIRESIDRCILTTAPRVLYLDFGGVSFMDSSGIGLILGRYRLMQSNGGKTRVVNASASVNKMLKLGGITLLDIWEDNYEKIG